MLNYQVKHIFTCENVLNYQLKHIFTYENMLNYQVKHIFHVILEHGQHVCDLLWKYKKFRYHSKNGTFWIDAF